MVKIYSITVTNALDGVAWACRACAIESQQPGSACVPCPAGYYIDEETNQCQECPPNTFLSGHHIYGRDACQPCGPGGSSNKVQSMPLPMQEKIRLLISLLSSFYDSTSCSVGRGNTENTNLTSYTVQSPGLAESSYFVFVPEKFCKFQEEGIRLVGTHEHN